jgi:hypothetical protein
MGLAFQAHDEGTYDLAGLCWAGLLLGIKYNIQGYTESTVQGRWTNGWSWMAYQPNLPSIHSPSLQRVLLDCLAFLALSASRMHSSRC